MKSLIEVKKNSQDHVVWHGVVGGHGYLRNYEAEKRRRAATVA